MYIPCKKQFTDSNELLKFAEKYNKIVVIGFPKTGKTTLSNQFNSDKYTIIHSDKYKSYPYKDQVYLLINELKSLAQKNFVIEGVQCFRLLRKIEELKLSNIRPDLIIYCHQNQITPKYQNFIKGLTKIWNDYISLLNTIPTIILYTFKK